jgi:hypothetical protein
MDNPIGYGKGDFIEGLDASEVFGNARKLKHAPSYQEFEDYRLGGI